MGKLTDKHFLKLSQQYETGQEQLENELAKLTAEVGTMQKQADILDKFMALVNRYTSFDELTTPMLNEFVEKVVVHERESVGRYKRKQRGNVYLTSSGWWNCRPPKQRRFNPPQNRPKKSMWPRRPALPLWASTCPSRRRTVLLFPFPKLSG